MTNGSRFFRGSMTPAALAILGTLTIVPAFAQGAQVPDAQVESSVLKSLAAVPELADQAIGTTTVYGTVTLTGSVRDEASRDKAEQAVANTPGVKKVVDELVIGTPDASQPVQANTPQQSAPSDPVMSAPVERSPQLQQPAPSYPQQPTYPPQPQARYPQNYPGYPNTYPQPGYPQYPQQTRQPYHVQQAGQPVVVPAGTILRVRINQPIDSRRVQPGDMFDGVVLTDIFTGDSIAIPRGAPVEGRVADIQPGNGREIIALELTNVTVGSRSYPLATEAWSHQSQRGSNGAQTAGNAIGLGAIGAMIGAVAGGPPGALLGAGLGAATGIIATSATRPGAATTPAEAIVNFRLAQQAELTTISQAELDRLGAGLPRPYGQPQMQRRYAPPPPPPYYGPYYYPSPYYYPYYR